MLLTKGVRSKDREMETRIRKRREYMAVS